MTLIGWQQDAIMFTEQPFEDPSCEILAFLVHSSTCNMTRLLFSLAVGWSDLALGFEHCNDSYCVLFDYEIYGLSR